MNSQWHHILHRPNLQDLRRLKFTRQLVHTKYYNLMNLHMYRNGHEGQLLHQCLARDVNLRGIFLMFGGLIAITAILAAVPRVFPALVY
jgi:hypothetical protein